MVCEIYINVVPITQHFTYIHVHTIGISRSDIQRDM